MSNEEASGDALSDADAERLSKRHRTEYHLLKIGLNAGKQNPNVDGQCLMNVGEMVDEAVNEPHGATASQSAGSSNSCAAAANTGAAADAEEAVHRQAFRKDVKK